MKLQCDLFDFAYVPGWYWQLDCLAEMALPEPWRFREPVYSTKNLDTPILERYIHSIFKKQAIDFNSEGDPAEAARHNGSGQSKRAFEGFWYLGGQRHNFCTEKPLA